MLIEEKLYLRPSCTLSIPHVTAESADETEPASLMNTFYEKMAKEIFSYTENEECSVRRYRSEFEFSAENGESRIMVKLTVRKIGKDGSVCILRRSIFNLWRGGKLAVFRVSDL